jgi:hypothetical protein
MVTASYKGTVVSGAQKATQFTTEFVCPEVSRLFQKVTISTKLRVGTFRQMVIFTSN